MGMVTMSVAVAVVDRVSAAGIPLARVALAGFSQGACLALEFAARRPDRYGAVLGFSGAVIGPPEAPRPPAPAGASLGGAPVFLGCGDRDGHIPVERVEATARVLTALGGRTDVRIYPGMGHTINEDEIAAARSLLSGLL